MKALKKTICFTAISSMLIVICMYVGEVNPHCGK